MCGGKKREKETQRGGNIRRRGGKWKDINKPGQKQKKKKKEKETLRGIAALSLTLTFKHPLIICWVIQ